MICHNHCDTTALSSLSVVLTLCLTVCLATTAGAIDHRMVVKIEKEVKIVPAGTVTRGMMSMVRHPDGTIFLNVQTEPPKLYKSSDNGQTWTTAPVKFTGVPPNQVTCGLGVDRKGRLFLIHQNIGRVGNLYGQSLFVSYSDDSGKTWILSATDLGKILPGLPNMQFHEDGNRTFIEQPDGTLMFTTTIVLSPDYGKKMEHTKNPLNRRITRMLVGRGTSSAISYSAVLTEAKPGTTQRGSTQS